jgi:transcriptional regulator with XRE-family HTH domain
MFENLLKPNPIFVGQRIAKVKDELGVSFTELGNRLGVPKPTISSYVYGKSLAPEKIIKKLSKISNKRVGWFYFGEIEDYIHEYLVLKGYLQLLLDYPKLVLKIKEEYLFGQSKNPGWANEFGYPYEEWIDDCFAGYLYNIKKEYIQLITIEFVTNKTNLKGNRKEEAITLISTSVSHFFNEVGDFEYGNREEIFRLVEDYYNRNIREQEISFDEHNLVGRLINILNDSSETADLINQLSLALTKKRFSTFFGGEELINVFRSMRPELIKLYAEKTERDFEDWFGKGI